MIATLLPFCLRRLLSVQSRSPTCKNAEPVAEWHKIAGGGGIQSERQPVDRLVNDGIECSAGTRLSSLQAQTLQKKDNKNGEFNSCVFHEPTDAIASQSHRQPHHSLVVIAKTPASEDRPYTE